jgi:hypothetical protein
MTHSLRKALLLATVVFSANAAIAAEQIEAPASTENKASIQLVSEEEFQTQREFMIKDTAKKAQVMQAAHDCAKAAETQAAFAECNKQLREAILGKAN